MVYKNAPLEQTNGAYDGSENRTRFCYLAAFNPRITAEENPAASISFSPFMVIPPGVVTLSISTSGWEPLVNNNSAAPLTVCSTSKAASLG